MQNERFAGDVRNRVDVFSRTYYELKLEDGRVLRLSTDEAAAVYRGLREAMNVNTHHEAPGPSRPQKEGEAEGKPERRREGKGSRPWSSILIAAVIVAAGIAAGTTLLRFSSGATTGGAPYTLRLVITTNNWFNNSVGYQPSYFVVEPNGSLSSVYRINLPANVPINLIIVDYDNGSAFVPPEFLNVTGVSGGYVTVVNNTNVNKTVTAGGSAFQQAGYEMSSAQPNTVAHTFTVFGSSGNVLINIPVLPLSTEFATFTLHSGTYHWQCEAECGSGPAGVGGAMDTPGWMSGTLVAA